MTFAIVNVCTYVQYMILYSIYVQLICLYSSFIKLCIQYIHTIHHNEVLLIHVWDHVVCIHARSLLDMLTLRTCTHLLQIHVRSYHSLVHMHSGSETVYIWGGGHIAHCYTVHKCPPLPSPSFNTYAYAVCHMCNNLHNTVWCVLYECVIICI